MDRQQVNKPEPTGQPSASAMEYSQGENQPSGTAYHAVWAYGNWTIIKEDTNRANFFEEFSPEDLATDPKPRLSGNGLCGKADQNACCVFLAERKFP